MKTFVGGRALSKPKTAAQSTDIALGLDLLQRMTRIRRFEERVALLRAAGEPVTGHLYIGQEAVAAGVCAALLDEDYVTSTHRGHGHIIAKGGDLGRCMAELFGKATGYCGGKGGSMHLADVALGIIGANGIVGAGLPIAVGAALSAQLQRLERVSVCFFGDGAANQGTFHESLNLAAVWSLPVVFVCENNGWAELTRAEAFLTAEIGSRAAAYSLPGVVVNGNDAFAVHETAANAVARAREGAGPTLIEARTYRVREHAESLDRYAYLREPSEVNQWVSRDPIALLWQRMVGAGASEGDLAALEKRVVREVDEAEAFARASLDPDPETAVTDVFA